MKPREVLKKIERGGVGGSEGQEPYNLGCESNWPSGSNF